MERYFKVARNNIVTAHRVQELDREDLLMYLEEYADAEIVAEYKRQEKEIDVFWYELETNQLIQEWLEKAMTEVYKDDYGVYIDGGIDIGDYTIYIVNDDDIIASDLPRRN